MLLKHKHWLQIVSFSFFTYISHVCVYMYFFVLKQKLVQFVIKVLKSESHGSFSGILNFIYKMK